MNRFLSCVYFKEVLEVKRVTLVPGRLVKSCCSTGNGAGKTRRNSSRQVIILFFISDYCEYRYLDQTKM